ncbi:MAG TPA: group II intron maturase-specific domain-containing protein, partial [Candidatus Lokiarchaeia archaeon]|nr:group II intron maturase-specific domain-containing protein [Candidatus Lokiarchaeia archaeon]
ELHAVKTRVTTRGAGFNFLGFTIRQIWTKYHKILLVTPQKEKVKHLLAQVKTIIASNKQAKQANLVKLLNPVIRGWARYYCHCNAKKTFNYVDSRIFRMIWKWCVRRHPKKGKHWVKARYFLTLGQKHWVFGEQASCRLASAAEVPVTRYAKVRGYYSPLDPAHRSYWAWRTRQSIGDWYFSPMKKAILATQRYRCWKCELSFQADDAIHFHHETPRHQGGPTSKDNLRAVHSRCHRLLHKYPD